MLIGISVLTAAPVSQSVSQCSMPSDLDFCPKEDQYLIAYHVSLLSVSTRLLLTEVRDLVSFSEG